MNADARDRATWIRAVGRIGLAVAITAFGLVAVSASQAWASEAVEANRVDVPRVDVPRVDVPRIGVPRVGVPRVGVPSVDAPPQAGDLRAPLAGDAPARAPFEVRPTRDPGPRYRRSRRTLGKFYGPAEVREEWILAQPRLTLPPIAARGLGRGERTLTLHANRGNDFGWNQTEAGETPGIRRFLVDGEHQTVALEFQQGFGRGWTAGVLLPVQWRGAGFMDDIIDPFHALSGGKDNIRDEFFINRYRVEGLDGSGNPISWNDSQGWGMGNLEISVRKDLCFGRCSPWSAAVVGRASLPTGTGPYKRGGVDLGVQGVVARTLGPRWQASLGGGATWISDETVRGVHYSKWRYAGFAALEYIWDARTSIVLDLTVTSRLVDNLAKYHASQSYVDLAVHRQLSHRLLLTVGLTENIENQQTTIDVGAFVALRWQW